VQNAPNSVHAAKAVDLFQHLAKVVSQCAQGLEEMEVGFVGCHVLQALCTEPQK
jgi:hypothetical protein